VEILTGSKLVRIEDTRRLGLTFNVIFCLHKSKTIMLIGLWIFFAFFVGAVFGAARKIGFFMSFLASLVLSSIIGLIITLFSETNKSIEEKKKIQYIQEGRNCMTSNQFGQVLSYYFNDLS